MRDRLQTRIALAQAEGREIEVLRSRHDLRQIERAFRGGEIRMATMRFRLAMAALN